MSSDENANDTIDNVFKLNEYMKAHPEESSVEPNEEALNMIGFETETEKEDSIQEIPDEEPESKKMQLVQYDHDKKPKRLGRPRNHVLNNVRASSTDANENEEKSKYMLYRLDDKPVEGPGSRGGKGTARVKKGKVTASSIRDKKKQSQLTFGNGGISVTTKSDKSNLENNPETKDLKPDDAKPKVSSELKTEPKPKKQKTVKTETPIDKSTSRTTVLNSRHKVTRQFDGPLIGLYYEAYDENLMKTPQNDAANKESLAFGFELKKAPYADDIIFLVSYISRFGEVLNIDKIGPQDIEEGIGLNHNSEDPDVPPVSPLMNILFARLVTLVLNRKPEVKPQYQGKAISELKAVCTSLGLPLEWKDRTEVYQKFTIDESEAVPVDESKGDILLTEGYAFHPPYVYENPFNDKQGFEKSGFPGIANPVDRLIMLRSLAQWSLTSSNDIKTAISDLLQKQDLPGDKETFYASRAVLKGFKHTQDLTKEINNKISKKKLTEDSDMVARYVEPISNPMDHPVRLRLDEMVVGDIGFHIGRFLLVRVADAEDGGLASVEQMQQAWSNTQKVATSIPSRFKLYVQDVHQLLVERLAQEGIEFVNGEEKPVPALPEEHIDTHYYEVASNAGELEAFVSHLALRLGEDLTSSQDNIIPASSIIYKPARALYEYLSGILPLLTKQEGLFAVERSSRKRKVDYTKQKEEEDEDYEDDFGDLEDILQADDDDDDDYMD